MRQVDKDMSKKTESIEFRLSPELKEKLSQLGTERGKAMSVIVRDLVEQEVSQSTSKANPGQAPFFPSNQRRLPTMTKQFTKSYPTFKSTAFAAGVLMAMGIGFNAMTINVAAAHDDIAYLFEKADANSNGEVDAQEFKTFAISEFELEDGADALSEEAEAEFNALYLPAACIDDLGAFEAMATEDIELDQEISAFFEELDQNADGKLTLSEVTDKIESDAQTEFSAIDGNGDGLIILAEFLTIASMEFEEALQGEEGLPTLSEACKTSLVGQEQAFLAEEFVFLDANEDGVITLDEYADNG